MERADRETWAKRVLRLEVELVVAGVAEAGALVRRAIDELGL